MTLLVNLPGGLVVGMAPAWFETRAQDGVLRGFTTVPAFSAVSLAWLEHWHWGMAAARSVAHVRRALGCTAGA